MELVVWNSNSVLRVSQYHRKERRAPKTQKSQTTDPSDRSVSLGRSILLFLGVLLVVVMDGCAGEHRQC